MVLLINNEHRAEYWHGRTWLQQEGPTERGKKLYYDSLLIDRKFVAESLLLTIDDS
jgi:hypothetical protein